MHAPKRAEEESAGGVQLLNCKSNEFFRFWQTAIRDAPKKQARKARRCNSYLQSETIHH